MKKIIVSTLVVVLVLSMGLFAGCGNASDANQDADLVTIKVGASATPHAEILAAIKDDMAAQGYDLQIVEFTDYVQPNLSLEDGGLDANYFQHAPYLENFNAEHGTKLVSVAKVHYEPLGLYPGKKATVDELAEGDIIAVPNDTTNEARALLLLQDMGLLKLKEDIGLMATPKDIVENPKNLKFKELEAAQVARSLQDVAMGVVNGNNALLADLNAATDAVAMEEKDSLAAETYANILAVREGEEKRAEVQALIKALQSETAKKFIEKTYEGAVVAVF